MVVYVGYDEVDGLEVQRLRSWRMRTGLRDMAIGSGTVRGSITAFGADGSLVAVAGDPDLVLLDADADGNRVLFGSHGGWLESVLVHSAADLVLLDYLSTGIEALRASSAESLWERADLDPERGRQGRGMMLTQDHASVVVVTDDGLLVLDASNGKTRFGLQHVPDEYREIPVIPVVNDTVVESVLRWADGRVERLDLRDGSAIDSTNLGVSSLEFAVSDRTGDMYLVADGDGQVVLWDTGSGERVVFESSAIGPESVAFSPDGHVLAMAEIDGTVALWDVSSGPRDVDRLGSLITFENGDWAVVGADGRYDASDPADLEGLAWVMPDAPTEPVPLSVFYRDYYEPGLLPRLLAGESFSEVTSIAALDREQPLVEIVAVEPSGSGQVNVTVEVDKGEAGGVGDLKLFRDGRLVGLDESARRRCGDSCDTWQRRFDDIALPTRGGSKSVEFSAYAFNADGVKSDTARMQYEYRSTESELRARRAFVVVVGVNAYENRTWDLHYAAEDARATSEMITRYMRESDVFDEVHTVSLIAERDDDTGRILGSATRTDLLAVLDGLAGEAVAAERLEDLSCEVWSGTVRSASPATVPCMESLREALPDDLVYLSFSGHGLSGENGLFHLFLSDIGEGDARVVDEALLKRTLDSDELADKLRKVDAGDFVMVIDACNAAASVEGGGFKPGPMGSRGLGQLAYDKAMRVLAASQAEEVALESRQLRHGLLTYAMLREGLEGEAANRAPEDEWIEIGEMLAYGVERVPLLYEAIGNDSSVAEADGLRGFTPSWKRSAGKLAVQRPSLFDFSRDEDNVRVPVLNRDDDSGG